VQNKVLEAVAAGLPTVVTPVVLSGVPTEVRPACVAADGPAAFADALVALLGRSAEERRGIAERADVESITWERRLGRLQEIVTTASASTPRA
jgi:glycosyltransferase involved in cell wall biosynthesis